MWPPATRVIGTLDVNALDRAFAEIVRRHEALRTTFTAVDGVPVQVIGPPSGRPLEYVDLSMLPADQRRLQAERLVAELTRRAFDLARGPLAPDLS